MELHRQGDLYYLGSLRPEDRAVFVRRVRGLSSDDLDAALTTVLGTASNSATFSDGLVIVSEKAAVLERLHFMLEAVESSERPSWAVQLYLISMARRDLLDLGVDVEPALDLAVAYSVGSAAVAANSLTSLDAGFRGLLRATEERSSMELVAAPMFLMIDGEDSQLSLGGRVPVPQTVISQEGRVTSRNATYVSIGTDLVVRLREVSAHAVRIDVNLELSELREVTAEGFPYVDTRNYKGGSFVRSGGVYLLTTIDIDRSRKRRAHLLHPGKSGDGSGELLQVWAKAIRVDDVAKPGSFPVVEVGVEK